MAHDFQRILTEPEASLITQYKALLKTEGVVLDFREEAIEEIAALAERINSTVENIGARRLHTILERLLEEISFAASDQPRRNRDHDRPGLCDRACRGAGAERRSVEIPSVGAAMRGGRALFLDRDGTINRDTGYLHRIEECVFVDGIFDLAQSLPPPAFA